MPAESAYANAPLVVAVAGVFALVAGIILYLNKRWCLYGINSLNCCDDSWGLRIGPKHRKSTIGVTGRAAASGSDSEEDGRVQEVHSGGGAGVSAGAAGGPAGAGAGAGTGRMEFAFHRQLQAHHGHPVHAQIPYRSGSFSGVATRPLYHQQQQQPQQQQYHQLQQLALQQQQHLAQQQQLDNHQQQVHVQQQVQLQYQFHQYHFPPQPPPSSSPPPPTQLQHQPQQHQQQHVDLISMAERAERGMGCAAGCVAGSSNCSSSSGSTTSEEDKILRHREGRGHSSHGHVVNFSANSSVNTWQGYPPRYTYQRKMEPPLEPVPEPPRDQRGSQDCIVLLHQEDGAASDIQSVRSVRSARSAPSASPPPGPGPRSCACGQLEVAFAYDAPMRNMTIHLLQARDIPSKDRGGSTHTQVRILLLPAKKQKCKSKVRHGEQPQFMESFLLNRINPEDVNSMGVRLRLYGCERMRRERLIGECVLSFASINLESETNMWLNLEPRANMALKTSASDLLSLARSDSTGSSHSMCQSLQMQHGGVPELLLGLAYNGTTGRLAVELIKGSHFRNLAMTRAPDTFVRLRMASSSGQEIARAKSSVRRGQPNPLFKETFIFQVALFQLPDVTLLISVYNKRSMKKKETIGWFSLGSKSSGEEEAAHWNDMCEVRGEQICRWHVLLDS